MNKKSLSESDICDRFISPALISADWEDPPRLESVSNSF